MVSSVLPPDEPAQAAPWLIGGVTPLTGWMRQVLPDMSTNCRTWVEKKVSISPFGANRCAKSPSGMSMVALWVNG